MIYASCWNFLKSMRITIIHKKVSTCDGYTYLCNRRKINEHNYSELDHRITCKSCIKIMLAWDRQYMKPLKEKEIISRTYKSNLEQR